MSLLLGWDNWGVGVGHEVDPWVWNQVGLELVDVDVQGTFESEGAGQSRHNLGDQSVQVGVGWLLESQGTLADVVDGFVIKDNIDIGVLEESVGGEHGVVWLNNGGGHLWGWVDGESELGLLTVVNGQALQKEGTETRSGTTTNSVEEDESLETGALVSKKTDSVQDDVDDLLSDGVVTASEVVGGVFLAGDQLLGVVHLAVCAHADLIDDGFLKVSEDGAGNVLAALGLGEEGVESIISATNGGVSRHLSVRLDTVLEAEKLPNLVTDLGTTLAEVDGDDFAKTHFEEEEE